jgi:hypothetical protein
MFGKYCAVEPRLSVDKNETIKYFVRPGRSITELVILIRIEHVFSESPEMHWLLFWLSNA